jgi:hypothetical protein
MLREQVLRGLGWEIVRIWSTDWWVDREGTLEKVHAALERLLEHSRQVRSTRQEREAAEAEAQAAIAKARADAGAIAETAQTETGAGEGPIASQQIDSDLQAIVGPLDADAFFDASYDDRLRLMVEHVAGIEGPVRDTVLARRIARAHGWQRTGARIQDRVSSIALSCLKSTEEDVGVFFWANDRGPEVPLVPRDGSEVERSVEEICMAELVCLAKLVAVEGKTGDSAIVAMAHRLGLHRVRAASRSRFEKAIELAR